MAANRMPAADVGVSAELVRCLLADQHPDLARLPVEFLANGWGNELYQVGDGLIARLPRRALGAHIIEHEQRWLPRLAPRLPLPIPTPERTGTPACGYPYPWSVVPYLPGVPAAQVTFFDPAGARHRRPPARTTSRPRTPASSRLPSTRSSACSPGRQFDPVPLLPSRRPTFSNFAMPTPNTDDAIPC
jgi:Phosphotransferase enzyme family